MSTDPSTARQAVALPSAQPPPAPPKKTAVVPGPAPGALIGAVLTLALGILLGVANQGATDTSMQLRVPCLLAALLMVGQGVVSFRRGLVSKPTVERIPEDEPVLRGRELQSVQIRAAGPTNVSALPPQKPEPAMLAVPVVVMVLAAWLGWSDLVTPAPDTLSALALVATFALFALGWSLLPNRH